jgi:hypothetical protein
MATKKTKGDPQDSVKTSQKNLGSQFSDSNKKLYGKDTTKSGREGWGIPKEADKSTKRKGK